MSCGNLFNAGGIGTIWVSEGCEAFTVGHVDLFADHLDIGRIPAYGDEALGPGFSGFFNIKDRQAVVIGIGDKQGLSVFGQGQAIGG